MTNERPDEVTISEFRIFGMTFRDREKVSWDIDWSAYDVPRIWSMVQGEDNDAASHLVMAFNKLSQYVDDAQRRLGEAGKRLAESWSGAEASVLAQQHVAEVVGAFQKDATG